jgi:hypothetical protein
VSGNILSGTAAFRDSLLPTKRAGCHSHSFRTGVRKVPCPAGRNLLRRAADPDDEFLDRLAKKVSSDGSAATQRHRLPPAARLGSKHRCFCCCLPLALQTSFKDQPKVSQGLTLPEVRKAVAELDGMADVTVQVRLAFPLAAQLIACMIICLPVATCTDTQHACHYESDCDANASGSWPEPQ